MVIYMHLFHFSKCQGGTFVCEARPCSASCQVYGDPHISTFDGLTYDMFGKCSYVLVDHCHYGEGGKKEFEIVIKNDQCQSDSLFTSCVRSLMIHLIASDANIYLSSIRDDRGRLSPTATIDGNLVRHQNNDQYAVDTIGGDAVVFLIKGEWEPK